MKKCSMDSSLLVILLVTGSANAAHAQARLPIAYISMQRIGAEAAEAKAAAAKLETMRQAKSGQITAKQQAVDAAHLAVVQAGGIFQRSRRATLEAEEVRQRAELQRLVTQAQADVQNLQPQLQKDFIKKITTI